MLKVLLGSRVAKDIKALEASLRQRIIDRLLLLRNNPRPIGAKKLEGGKNFWRIRVGDWRILYEIDVKRAEVKIYRVKHRSIIYRSSA